jgi:hypothetical protein
MNSRVFHPQVFILNNENNMNCTDAALDNLSM